MLLMPCLPDRDAAGASHAAVLFRRAGAVRRRALRSAEGASPLPAVGRTLDGLHADAMVGRIAARVSGDLHLVARLEAVMLDARVADRAARAPFDCPALHDAVLVGC